jgi:hypothetical protein
MTIADLSKNISHIEMEQHIKMNFIQQTNMDLQMQQLITIIKMQC